MTCHIAHTSECAEYKLVAAPGVDAIQLPEPGNIDHSVWRFDVQLHQIVKRGSPGHEARHRPTTSNGVNGILHGSRARVAEGLHGSGLPHLEGRILNGGNDADISAAAADVAAHVFADLFSRAGMPFPDARPGRHDLTRGAVATLQCVVIDEGLLHRMKR